ncbi:hypothetical protein [Hymenobacter psoromatis]|uniref:hypothetical protein n=1 Tax=Hymenobacter psoromatis TaxID=1484116 RepID=UPI001CBD2A36|nr:hypothetical protein [Hymenobacter psoromatis]
MVASLGLAVRPALAQQSAPVTIQLSPEDAARGQYGAQHNFYFLPPGKTGEENYQSAGFFGAKLRPYLAGHAQALQQLDNYKTQKTLYLADRILLVGSAVLYGSQVFGHGDIQYANSTQIAAGGLFVTSLVATLFINRHTNEYLKQAVDDYNTAPPGRHGTVWPRLRPAGVGVVAQGGHPVLGLRWRL